MAQIIKYENTKVPSARSAQQLGEIIAKYGAREFSLRWDETGSLIGVTFKIADPRLGAIVPVRIDARTDTIQDILASAYPSWDADRVELQAEWIAWRHIKDLCEQMLLAAKVDLFSVAELFMSGVVIETPEGPRTLGEEWSKMVTPEIGRQGGLKLLTGSE